MPILDPKTNPPFRLVLGLTNVGTTGEVTKTNMDRDFVVTSYRIGAFLNASSAGAAAGSPLMRVPSPTVASNTHYPLSRVLAKMSIGSLSIENADFPLELWGGVGDQDAMLEDPWIVPKKDSVTVFLRNQLGAAIDFWMVLRGYKN